MKSKHYSNKAYEQYYNFNGFNQGSFNDLTYEEPVKLINRECRGVGGNYAECMNDLIDDILELLFKAVKSPEIDNFMMQVRQNLIIEIDGNKYEAYWRGNFAPIKDEKVIEPLGGDDES